MISIRAKIKIWTHVCVLSCACFFSCTNKNEPVKEKNNGGEITELFTTLDFEETNLLFNNKLKETSTMNSFFYEYFYNGGGVATADFNNDGLQDIYFIGNLRKNKLFLNQGNLKFKNISIPANAQGGDGFHTGVCVVDINNDGLKDIYILKSGRLSNEHLQNELLINTGINEKGIPVFEERSKDFGLNLPHYSVQASFFDYDKDGDLDMFLLNHNPETYALEDVHKLMKEQSDKIGEKLYRNDKGKFVNVTEESGLISSNIGYPLGVAIGDVNNDGWPDVYVSHDYYEKDHLYLNNKNGTLKDASLTSFTHLPTFSMGNDIADINNDGLLDILSVDMMAEDNYSQKASMSAMDIESFSEVESNGLHAQYMFNALQLNNGLYPNTELPVFSDVAQLSGISSTDWSWAPLIFDMDNDGYRDVFVSNGIKRDPKNNDFFLYTEKKYRESLKKDTFNFEAHMDDLLNKMPSRKKKNYFYLNSKDLVFQKLDINQPETFSNGAAYADFDNDGDLDVVVNNVDEFALLYRNNQESNSFLKIKLVGFNKNIDAIGAKVELVTDTQQKLVAENYFTRGYQSAMAVPLHFGLGNANKVKSLKVIWPDGKSQQLQDLPVDEEMTITYAPDGKEDFDNAHKDFRFFDITKASSVQFKHKENEYNDFLNESLLPHKMSEEGPAMAVGDVNGDGLDDFYIGGSKSYAGSLFTQNKDGKFKVSNQNLFNKEKAYEDVDALFFDADSDGDVDLYVVSGSNEYNQGSIYYQDRLYLNNAGIFVKAKNPFKNVPAVSGSIVKPYDFDEDGDLDLFVGGRQLPGKYPYSGTSLLLRNDSRKGNTQFTNIETEILHNMGMVTDAEWVDIDGDNIKDLIVVGEWMPIKILKNTKGVFSDITSTSGLSKEMGWWFSVEAGDFDNDGDMDLIAGNLGMNSKYKASTDKPFQIHANDFDNSGTIDIVLSYEQDGKKYPLRGRECSSRQMPFIKKKFPSYHSFASAELVDVYGKDNMETALHYEATNFATCYFENTGKGKFTTRMLPIQAQTTAITSIISEDINQDGNLDLLLFGNIYGFEVETPRLDAGYGLYMEGDGDGHFNPVMPYKSGLYVKGAVANAKTIVLKDNIKSVGIAKNNDYFQLIKIN